jgi:hypothetical protein
VTLHWILGRCDSLRAEVFLLAGIPDGVDPADVTITGALTGPKCRRAITLPVTAKLVVMPAGPEATPTRTVVARAILTEPSYWTPELPSLYRLDARLVAEGREIARVQRVVGLRRFGVRGRSFWLDGRRAVPRGIVLPEPSVDVDRFREAALAAVVADPSENVLDRCDAEGVAVIGLLADADGQPLDAEAAAARITRWAWHAAVLMAVVSKDAPSDAITMIASETRRRRGTLLVAQEVDGSLPPPEGVQAADAVVVSLAVHAVPHPAWRAASPKLPLIARRAEPPAFTTTTPSRRECDVLQATLAAWSSAERADAIAWDWAGYCVDLQVPGT